MTAALALLATARAAVGVVVTDGPLRPGRAATIEVAATDDLGLAGTEPPALAVSGGSAKGPTAVRPGVWHWQLVPAIDAATVAIEAGTLRASFPVVPPPPSSLTVPQTVDALVRGDPPAFVITGAELPPPEALRIVPGEGRVASVEPVDGGFRVVLEPEDLSYPRWIPVAVLDLRREEAPAVTRVRLRARPRLPLQVEPGAELKLEVGGREYGPFVAAEDGTIDARVDQYPGELVAHARLVDDLGNETRTDVPLVSQTATAVVLVATGDIVPGRPPPLVHVVALDPSGGRPDVAPTCRTPASELAVRATHAGHVLSLLPLDPPQDVRVACVVGGVQASMRVRVGAGIPRALSLRVWPEELRADFPTAEVRVVLEDVRGERLPVDGIAVEAARGEVEMEPGGGIVGRGVYDGTGAAEEGEDVIRARYVAPRGAGPVEELALRWGRVPVAKGALELQARATDTLRRPVEGVTVRLAVGEVEAEAVTGPDGWAAAEIPVQPARAPLAASARGAFREAHALLLPGEVASATTGTADLQAVQAVRIRPGRVTGISISVDPAVLRAGPGAVAWVYVTLEDGAGQPVTDEPVEVEASEGTVGERVLRPDGTFVAEYTPLPIGAPREVVLTARTETVHTSTRLLLEPRVVRLSFGPWVGGFSNLGSIGGWIAGADFDVRARSRLVGEALIVRVGGAVTAFARSERVDGLDVEYRSTLVPLSLALLLREDRGAWGLWAGAGGAVAVHHVQPRFGDELAFPGDYVLGGPVAVGAVGRRALGGELALSLRASWFPATEQALGFRGNLGGLSADLGYRLVY